MSKQFLLNSFCITFLGAFVGYELTHVIISKQQSGEEQMASVVSEEPAHTMAKLGSHQIYQNYFDIRIKHEKISITEDGESIVKAIVMAKQNLPAGLNFKWKLGQNISSSAADIEGQLPDLTKGEKTELFITVYGFNKNSKTFLSFSVSGNIDGQNLFKETLSSSRPEDSFEYVVQQKHELEQKEDAANKLNGKVSAKSIRLRKFDPAHISR